MRYLWQYSSFMFLATLLLLKLHLSSRYDLIYVHNMPDILVLIALIPSLTGSKVILDMHDPVPEVYMTKYSVAATNFAVRFLIKLEQSSIRMADLVLTPNKAFRERFISRGCPTSKIHIIMNSAQNDIFNTKGRSNADNIFDKNRFIVMFHGCINERSGLHNALEAINIIRSDIKGLKFEVYGPGESYHKMLKYAEDLKLNDIVTFHGAKKLEEIAEAISDIDVGIIPNIMSPFTNINLPTRIMECMSMGKPVIAPKTEGILDYFDENSLFLFEPGNVHSLSSVILDVYRNPQKRRDVAEQAQIKYMNYRWELQKEHLIALISNLMEGVAINNSTSAV